jgi:hypothetical protein
MKIITTILLIVLMLFVVGCDTELGHHHHENHDHDGDGVQDHVPEEHDSEWHEENEDYIERNSLLSSKSFLVKS